MDKALLWDTLSRFQYKGWHNENTIPFITFGHGTHAWLGAADGQWLRIVASSDRTPEVGDSGRVAAAVSGKERLAKFAVRSGDAGRFVCARVKFKRASTGTPYGEIRR